jgi:hypothetical protein
MATKRIYLSPSNQFDNIGVGGYNEAVQMRILSDKVANYLKQTPMFIVRQSNEKMSLGQVVADSNNFDSDLHICLHSDAGPITAEGTTVYKLTNHETVDEIALMLYSAIAKLSPGKDRDVRIAEFFELKYTNAPAVLIENFFHTNPVEADNFLHNIDAYAKAIAGVIYEYYEVPKVYDNNSITTTTTAVHWSQKYYDYLTDKGMVIKDKRFDDKITRGEVLALLARSLGYKEV